MAHGGAGEYSREKADKITLEGIQGPWAGILKDCFFVPLSWYVIETKQYTSFGIVKKGPV